MPANTCSWHWPRRVPAAKQATNHFLILMVSAKPCYLSLCLLLLQRCTSSAAEEAPLHGRSRESVAVYGRAEVSVDAPKDLQFHLCLVQCCRTSTCAAQRALMSRPTRATIPRWAVEPDQWLPQAAAARDNLHEACCRAPTCAVQRALKLRPMWATIPHWAVEPDRRLPQATAAREPLREATLLPGWRRAAPLKGTKACPLEWRPVIRK
mmetsp:Transcript_70309/g.177777  ORF Transcript_70309/g.177777 Transcript_70309/m.177777 type:complete len:209 (+) Transcript_70309:16-642(+)